MQKGKTNHVRNGFFYWSISLFTLLFVSLICFVSFILCGHSTDVHWKHICFLSFILCIHSMDVHQKHICLLYGCSLKMYKKAYSSTFLIKMSQNKKWTTHTNYHKNWMNSNNLHSFFFASNIECVIAKRQSTCLPLLQNN